MTWLVTGGAGYIGAHIVHALLEADEKVVILDDLSTGLATRAPASVPLIKADVSDCAAVTAALRDYDAEGVIHLAARKDVGESVADPLRYYRENIDGLRSVLQAVTATGVRSFVFSSSAAVYGESAAGRVSESSPTAPSNPYGRSKLVGEWMLRDVSAATDLRHIALRYFNVAGAASMPLADIGETNLLPRLLRAVAEGRRAQVYGGRHPTPDGSCVRDFIDVRDLAEAHVAAALALRGGTVRQDVLNVGRGVGISVLEMIEAVRRICDVDLPADIVPARAGDPPAVVAIADRIRTVLGWQARHDLASIVSSAWSAVVTR
ncbi:UDP-glucose 4-epimerase GalE [Pilimelia columellifera]|uniref:UDP-glucose 4-epimerase n=1 Tax=Pilimelia columellifera subsp. columellifera TaxID=706583 RepID=A0ABN3N3Z2_9ACTN